ncbi:hypothetical protein, partial [Streptomyces sp. NPDC020362]|uniref:hypothetical protein n=1 Tax=Streptomyces sp. NPDC020362 TaxID=3154486 RepID=UPI0033FF9FE2
WVSRGSPGPPPPLAPPGPALGRALAELGHLTPSQERLHEAHTIFERLGLPDVADVATLLGELVAPQAVG